MSTAAYPDVLGSHTRSAIFRQLGYRIHWGLFHRYFSQLITRTSSASRPRPPALNYVEHNSRRLGELRVPALTLSTFRDPVAPDFHRAAYGAAVDAAGNSEWLTNDPVPGTGNGYGHCTFTPLELVTAFSDLVLWAEFGIKPTP